MFKIYGSNKEAGKHKAITYGYKPFETDKVKKFVEYINTHAIVKESLSSDTRRFENVTGYTGWMLFDLDAPNEWKKLEEFLAPYYYIKKPSTSNDGKKNSYKWHYLVKCEGFNKKPKGVKLQFETVVSSFRFKLKDVGATEHNVKNLNFRGEDGIARTVVHKGNTFVLPKVSKKDIKARFASKLVDVDTPIDLDEMTRLMEKIDPNDPTYDYHDWFAIGASLYTWSKGAKEGLKLFASWSAKREGYTDALASNLVAKWDNEFKVGIYNVGTICHYAKDTFQNSADFNPFTGARIKEREKITLYALGNMIYIAQGSTFYNMPLSGTGLITQLSLRGVKKSDKETLPMHSISSIQFESTYIEESRIELRGMTLKVISNIMDTWDLSTPPHPEYIKDYTKILGANHAEILSVIAMTSVFKERKLNKGLIEAPSNVGKTVFAEVMGGHIIPAKEGYKIIEGENSSPEMATAIQQKGLLCIDDVKGDKLPESIKNVEDHIWIKTMGAGTNKVDLKFLLFTSTHGDILSGAGEEVKNRFMHFKLNGVGTIPESKLYQKDSDKYLHETTLYIRQLFASILAEGMDVKQFRKLQDKYRVKENDRDIAIRNVEEKLALFIISKDAKRSLMINELNSEKPIEVMGMFRDIDGRTYLNKIMPLKEVIWLFIKEEGVAFSDITSEVNRIKGLYIEPSRIDKVIGAVRFTGYKLTDKAWLDKEA